MLRQKNYPKVYWYNGVTTTDISFFMLNYGRDPIGFHFHSTHYVYFGKNKPFNSIYVEMHKESTVSTTLTVEYWNGSAYVPVSNLVDDTKVFMRSGFIQFDKPTNWAKSTVGFDSQYFLRMHVASDLSNSTEVQGMNLVYSDDQDLNGIYPGVSSYLSGLEKTFILRHENSRNLIVQDIRNLGFRKYKDKYQNIDAWDLLEIEEVNLWSAYLTLSNIFSSLQSNQSDLFKQKAEEYREMAEFYKAQTYLTLDTNDDGLVDSNESAGDIRVRRLVRK